MENIVQLNSLYLATEGEGVLIGTPQIFIRYQGCNIGCLNCDSKETWAFKNDSGVLVSSVLRQIELITNDTGVKKVSITGGDPLHPSFQSSLCELLSELKKRNYWVNIEASGSRLAHEVFDAIDFISFDYKTPSTGVITPLVHLEKLAIQYKNKFQIKSVIQNREDFNYVVNAYKILQEKINYIEFPWVLTPANNPGTEFNLQDFRDLVNWNQNEGCLFRVIGQQHKWMFGSEAKQV